jgi:hypothetical protein
LPKPTNNAVTPDKLLNWILNIIIPKRHFLEIKTYWYKQKPRFSLFSLQLPFLTLNFDDLRSRGNSSQWRKADQLPFPELIDAGKKA